MLAGCGGFGPFCDDFRRACGDFGRVRGRFVGVFVAKCALFVVVWCDFVVFLWSGAEPSGFERWSGGLVFDPPPGGVLGETLFLLLSVTELE